MTIILAEDNAVNATLINLILRDFDIDLDFAVDGEELLKALPKRRYDLVLMDLSMPRMDGLEAARRIRAGDAGERNADLPIVAISTHCDRESRLECARLGINEFIEKPVDPQQLRELLEVYRPRPEPE